MALADYISRANNQLSCDLILKNASVVNVLAGEIHPADIGIFNDKIVSFNAEKGEEVIDLNGKFVLPGFIDGHVHIESAMVSPAEFARAVVPHGTTTVIADPHEIVNVMGEDGLKYMLDASENLPLDIFFMLPSCVPATHLETSGSVFNTVQIKKWLSHPRILGLAEMMNYPGVIFQDSKVLEKITACQDYILDGHSPLLTGRGLDAYLSAGIRSDHEVSALEEAKEKLRKGMFLMMREGSAAQNLVELLPVLNETNIPNCCFVTDDRHPDFLLSRGHIDDMVRIGRREGISFINLARLSSLNVARYFRLYDRGAVAIGRKADLVISGSCDNFQAEMVIKNGKIVAQRGQLIADENDVSVSLPGNTVKIKPTDLTIPAKSDSINLIQIIPNQIITKLLVERPLIKNGLAVSDTHRDIIKLAVLERHNETGNAGLGFVRGTGLKSGALATTVAHDSHNLIVLGENDSDMHLAIQRIQQIGGGLVCVSQGTVIAELALPIAGIMSDQSLELVGSAYEKMEAAAKTCGITLDNIFMALSFWALPVIPEVKLTDRGLVDVNKFDFISLFN